jgi:hypothetical protein
LAGLQSTCGGECRPAKTESIEYQTTIVGTAYLVKGILTRLRFVSVMDAALRSQPDIQTTYGALAQVIVANRLTFQPMPLYKLAEWASEQGLDHVFDVEAEWLDDDRLGGLAGSGGGSPSDDLERAGQAGRATLSH